MTRILAGVLVLVSALAAQAPPEVIQKIVAEEDQNSQVMVHLDQLVNGIGARLSSSDALTTACEWARDKFKSYGLHSARLEEWGTFPVGFNRGPWWGTATTPDGSLSLVFITPAWTPGTKGPQQGPVKLAPESTEEFLANAASFRGAWVMGMPKGLKREDRDRVFSEAGALGVITSARGGGKEKDILVLTGGNQKVDYDHLPTLVTIQLQGRQYEALKEKLAAGQPVEALFDIRNGFKRGPIPLYNVLAELPGTEKPEELVIIGGHIDSWDGATGTADDGTGVATTIEAARLLTLAGARPRRSIRFMLWSAEEQGLLGSGAYVKKHPEENDRVSACLVHDGGTDYVSGITVTEQMYEDAVKVFEPLFNLNPEMPFKLNTAKTLPFMGGSDHASYFMAGVPGFFWTQSGGADYTHIHHTQFDTYDAAIPKYQRHTAKVVAIAALGLANLPNKLNREGVQAAAARGPRGRLGVDYAAPDNLEITEVVDDSPAARSGFKVKDKIIKIEGQPVKDRGELREALMSGDTSAKKVTVLRGGAEVVLTLSFDQPAPKPGEARKDGEKKDPEKKN